MRPTGFLLQNSPPRMRQMRRMLGHRAVYLIWGIWLWFCLVPGLQGLQPSHLSSSPWLGIGTICSVKKLSDTRPALQKKTESRSSSHSASHHTPWCVFCFLTENPDRGCWGSDLSSFFQKSELAHLPRSVLWARFDRVFNKEVLLKAPMRAPPVFPGI